MMRIKGYSEYIKQNIFFPLLNKLEGNVLEIGIGYDWPNFSAYNANSVNLTAIDLVKTKNITPSKILTCDASDMPFKNDSFDVIVFSFFLCSVIDPLKVINEIKRVMRPGSKLVIMEHIASKRLFWRIIQNILGLYTRFFNHNCHLNRKTQLLLSSNGFSIVTEKVYPNHFEDYLVGEYRL